MGNGHADLCKTFVYSKLEGAALECVPVDPATVDVITNALKEHIKPDSSESEKELLTLFLDVYRHWKQTFPVYVGGSYAVK